MVRILGALLGPLVVLGACGGPEPTREGGSQVAVAPEAAVRERLEALWAAVPSGDAAAVAPFLAYAGPDRERRYREPARFENDQKQAIERVAARIAGHLAAGPPHFERFEMRAKGEQSWVAWHLTFGAGEKPKKALYAFVQVGATWVLGDID